MATSDRVVVITGAASGIGRATALAFARLGRVALHLTDVRADGLAATCDEACRSRGARASSHLVDSADAGAVAALADAVFAQEGRVDVLHNNAGVCCGGPVEQLGLDDWRWQVDVNLWGAIHGVHAFLPRMLDQPGGGWIVNTASMAGLVGLPLVAPYCATKFAIVGLSEALDAELSSRGVRVIAVCPGAVRTGLLQASRLRLPDRWTSPLARALARYGSDPARIGRLIVATVSSDPARAPGLLLPAAADMLPLFVIKRLSPGLYQRLARLLGRQGARIGSARSSIQQTEVT